MHIDGAWARVPSKAEFNKGNVHFELQLFATTEITSLGQHLLEEENVALDVVDLADVIHTELGNKISKII